MIKQSLLNVGENFFSQTFLLLLPVLIFSASLEFSLIIGTLSLVFIYFSSLLFLSFYASVARRLHFFFLLSLATLSGTLLSSLSYYFYFEQFTQNAYLVNLYFICSLCWQKKLLKEKALKIKDLNQQILPSLVCILLSLWLSAFLREVLGTGCLKFFGFTISIIPARWILPVLSSNTGALACVFLSACLLGLKPQNYQESLTNSPKSSSLANDKNLKQSILQKTSHLEKLLRNSNEFLK